MRKRVILTLIKGSFEQGFPAILRIREGSTLHETETLGSLPPARNILQVFNNWQAAYDQWQSTYRIRPNPGQVTNFSCREIAALGSQLADALNNWLNSDSRDWQKIRDQLQRSLNEADEIQFIIQTEDIRLRQLPWHLWDLFSKHYTKAEIALSAPEYRSPPPPNPTNKVKILAILGDSTGINVEQDKAILQKELPDAEIKFLTQPELKLLNDSLWEQQWDILFFAGHSASQADGSTGQISINQDDSLLLSDLRNALRKAISRGLQLAIFNSCDGLGLAQELADLNIPQIIVMRKPVPDFVAQEFLRHFLKVFASGKSLYLAVREARERLQGLEKQFPCASWLPVICQNPTKEPLTWPELYTRSIRQCWSLPLQQATVFLLPILILFMTSLIPENPRPPSLPSLPSPALDLYEVVPQGTNGTDLHATSQVSNYKNFIVHEALSQRTPIPLHSTTQPNWQFGVADYNSDGSSDFYAIKTRGECGRTKVFIYDGTDNFGANEQVLLADCIGAPFSSYLSNDGKAQSTTQWLIGDYNQDGKPDLWDIQTLGASGKVEVHIWSGADRFRGNLLSIATIQPALASKNQIGQVTSSVQFSLADYNRDGKLDVAWAELQGGSGTTELHVLDGATNYQSYLVHSKTAQGIGGQGIWKWIGRDYNGDGQVDLIGIATLGTDSGKTEVHVLDAASNYQTFIAHIATAHGANGLQNYNFYLPAP